MVRWPIVFGEAWQFQQSKNEVGKDLLACVLTPPRRRTRRQPVCESQLRRWSRNPVVAALHQCNAAWDVFAVSKKIWP